jgi:hypothetical protein
MIDLIVVFVAGFAAAAEMIDKGALIVRGI